jgi:zinc/manganese transport system substrate-binding protein
MTTILNTRWRVAAALAGVSCAVTLLTTACGASATGSAGAGKVLVVAAENFWGSLATQLGGDHVQVISIITSPNTDPHAYEPTPQDGRTIAQAQYAIVNGAGYDPWAPKLIAANPSGGRRTLTVADLAGRREGDNPHMWYDPTIVGQVIDRISSDLRALDPADASYFDQKRATFTSVSLKHYNDLRASIKAASAGVPVGATESIFVDLAQDLGLNLITPPAYMKAISEGNDPSAADKATVDAQITGKQIKVLVFNSQNSTPDIQALVDKARAGGIPVVPITETLEPASATFQAWQSGQLAALQTALAQATGR